MSTEDLQQQKNTLDNEYNELKAKYQQLNESKQSVDIKNQDLQLALDMARNTLTSESNKETEGKNRMDYESLETVITSKIVLIIL